MNRPYTLTIAGFDPSGGAGILADIKTFEAHKTYGLSVCTALTVQNDISMKSCEWVRPETIMEQLEIVLERFPLEVVKIGIIESWQMLNSILDRLLNHNPKINIVLDPVLTSSSSFNFHEDFDSEVFDKILEKVTVLTPNYQEIIQLYTDKNTEETIQHISSKTNLFLKGGHHPDKLGKDFLYTKTGKVFPMNPKKNRYFEKHGSGCVLASAIAANLANGYPLLKSCIKAKQYTGYFLRTNKSLLGYHKF